MHLLYAANTLTTLKATREFNIQAVAAQVLLRAVAAVDGNY